MEKVGGIDVILGFDCVLRELDARNRQVLRDISDLYRTEQPHRLRHLWRTIPHHAPEPDADRHRLRPSAKPPSKVTAMLVDEITDIQRLRKINAALISRVERAMDQQGNAFSLFQTAINLESRVRNRTEELRSTMRRLEESNIDLFAAKEAAELARPVEDALPRRRQPRRAAAAQRRASLGLGAVRPADDRGRPPSWSARSSAR